MPEKNEPAERYEVDLIGLERIIRWCQHTPWETVGGMLRIATTRGWLKPLPSDEEYGHLPREQYEHLLRELEAMYADRELDR